MPHLRGCAIPLMAIEGVTRNRIHIMKKNDSSISTIAGGPAGAPGGGGGG